MKSDRFKVLGVPVDANYSIRELLQELDKVINSKNSGTKTVFCVNPEKIMLARKDTSLMATLADSDFLIPDGVGVVFAIRALHKRMIFRITGIDLMKVLLNEAQRKGYRIFIFGAKSAVLSKAVIEIKKRYPSLIIVGSSHGYVQENRYASLVNEINSLKADILFVGLGSPKQENWIHDHKDALNVKLCMGIGGSLDVISGYIPRAPYFLRAMGMEWLYRLIKEPNRIRRQILLPYFFFELLKAKLM